MAFIFKTYYKNGRKYAKFGKEIILMEPNVQDKVEELCKQHFHKFKIQFMNSDKTTFMLTISDTYDTSLFEESVVFLLNGKVYYDIIRVKSK